MNLDEIKFIANVNIEKPIIEFLEEKGCDVKWVAEINKQMSDTHVCEIANDENRILLNKHLDKISNHFVIVTKEKFRFIPLEENNNE